MQSNLEKIKELLAKKKAEELKKIEQKPSLQKYYKSNSTSLKHKVDAKHSAPAVDSQAKVTSAAKKMRVRAATMAALYAFKKKKKH